MQTGYPLNGDNLFCVEIVVNFWSWISLLQADISVDRFLQMIAALDDFLLRFAIATALQDSFDFAKFAARGFRVTIEQFDQRDFVMGIVKDLARNGRALEVSQRFFRFAELNLRQPCKIKLAPAGIAGAIIGIWKISGCDPVDRGNACWCLLPRAGIGAAR